MLPLRLELQGFMPYRHETIDFTALPALVGISGRNGEGKSALVEGLRYALFGRGRYDVGKRAQADPLVHDGETAMWVTLDFALAGETYRVIRGRSTKGSGKTVLELQRRSGEAWSPVTGSSIRGEDGTQDRIESLLRLSDASWCMTSLLLQGDSAAFSQAGPTERKRVLADILSLDLYPRMVEVARRRGRDAEGRVTARREQVESLEGKAAELDTLRGELAEVEAARTQLAAEVAGLEEGLREREGILAAQGERQRQLDDLTARRKRVLAEAETDALRIGRETAEAIGRVRAEIGEERGRTLRELEGRRSGLARDLDSLRHRQGENDTRRRRLEDLLAREEAIRTAAAGLEGARGALEVLNAAGVEVECHRAAAGEVRVLAERARGEHRAKVAEREAKVGRLRQGFQDLQQRAGRLDGDIRCIDLSRARCVFLADAQEARTAVPEAASTLQIAEGSLEAIRLQRPWLELEEQAAGLERTIADLGWSPEQHEEARTAYQGAQRAHDRLADLDAARGELQALVGSEEALAGQVAEKGAALAAIVEEKTAIGTQADQRLQERTGGLAEQEAARKAEVVARAEEQAEELGRRAEGLRAELAGVGNLRAAVEEGRRAVQARREVLGYQERVAGTYQERIAQAEEAGREAKRLRADMGTDLRRVDVFGKLARVLDPRVGVPVEIIKTVLPELEADADALLARLSGGEMRLRFTTEKVTKTAGLADTLDIEVAQAGHRRLYEGFSGGQRFRIDFACRIALSRLLSRRAGAELRLLVIDEGFGSQDPQGLEALYEAIGRVRDDFGLILVVSHVDELVGRLPGRLHVAEGRIRRVA